MPIIHEATLVEEEQAVEHQYPHFHVWHSDGMRIYATRTFTGGEITEIARRTHLRVPASVTLDAPTPQLIGHVIAVWLHEFPGIAA